VALGTRYTDLCYGYNAFWSRVLPELHLDCLGFEIETMMNIRAARAGLRVQEIPSHEKCRVHGTSNLRVVFDGWRIFKVIAAETLANRRSRSRMRREAVTSEPELSVPSVAATADVSKD